MNLNFPKTEVTVDKELSKGNYARFYIEPLERGYAKTLGTALRRVMLSSLPGVSVIGFKMKGVSHLLMTMPDTATDAVELKMAVQKLKFEVPGDEVYTLKLKIKEPRIYTSSDLELPKGVKLLNPNVPLLIGNGTGEQTIEIYVAKGKGFVNGREHTNLPSDDAIGVDGLFSPVYKVGFREEGILTKDVVTHERLVFDVETNGDIDPRDAIQLGARITKSLFDFFDTMSDKVNEIDIYKEKEKETRSINNMTIAELDLSVRSTNALIKVANIHTVGELRKISEFELGDYRNMGKKSVVEVVAKLKELGVELGDLL